jgi:hypothetical protein
MKTCGEWRYGSTILDFGSRRRWMVSFTPRPLFPRRKNPRYPLDTRLGGPQSRSGRCGVEKNPLLLPRNRTLAVQTIVIPAPYIEHKTMIMTEHQHAFNNHCRSAENKGYRRKKLARLWIATILRGRGYYFPGDDSHSSRQWIQQGSQALRAARFTFHSQSTLLVTGKTTYLVKTQFFS